MENTAKNTVLKSLTIDQNPSYAANPGQYSGKVVYESDGGSLTINLDETVSQNLLAFLGPVLVQASSGLAHQISHCLQTSFEAATNKAREIEATSQAHIEESDRKLEDGTTAAELMKAPKDDEVPL